MTTTVKLIYLARRAASVARADWPRTWKSHAIFASQFPVLEARIDWMRYCNRIDGIDLDGVSTAHDGVAIAASDSIEGLNGAGFAPEDREKIDTDELRVFDLLTPNFTWYCEETPVVEGPLGEVAVFAFLARKQGLSRGEFWDRWDGAGAQVAADALKSGFATRHAHNRPLGEPLPLFPFDGIAETWYPDAGAAIAAFADEALDPLRRDLADFCDLAKSTVMLTSVCHRWPRERS